LYQVVNDQRTLPPIESMSTKMLVDLSEITSWGYFDGLGFATKEGGAIRPVSATHKVDQRTYLSPAPASPVDQPLVLAYVPTSRGETAPKKEANKIVQVHWDALDPAIPPDYVMLLSSSDFERYPSFRAIWTGKNAIGKDGGSTIFGFTSNMPPTIEPVRLRTSREASREAGLIDDLDKAKDKTTPVKNADTTNTAVKLAQADAEGEAPGPTGPGRIALAGIEGRVPTPYPIGAGLAFNPPREPSAPRTGGGLPWAGAPTPPPPPASGGGGGSFTPAVSSANNGFPPIFSGGGGFASPFVVTQTLTTPASNATAAATANANVVVNNNFSVSQSQQQSQHQFQFQRQGQGQRQSQGRHGGNHGGGGHGGGSGGSVVPEPASIIGLALGLPALIVAYRRRRTVGQALPPDEAAKGDCLADR
jgi:hypothetical protein